MSSWFLAFALVQIAPRDVVYDALTRHVFLAFVVKVGAALYKLRKFNFVVGACPHCSLQFLLGVMLVEIRVDINQREECSPSSRRVDGVSWCDHAVAESRRWPYGSYRTPTPSPQSTHAGVRSTACKRSRRSRSTATTRVVGA